MNIECPFISPSVFGDDVDCPYEDRGMCDEIEVNTANGDAWCSRMIAISNSLFAALKNIEKRTDGYSAFKIRDIGNTVRKAIKQVTE